MPTQITIKEDDTDPLTFTIDATGISNLDNLSSAAVYARKVGASSNHVDGASASVKTSADQTVEFDPAGNAVGGGDAFDEPGEYKVYVKATWADGDVTRHPGDGFNWIIVESSFE